MAELKAISQTIAGTTAVTRLTGDLDDTGFRVLADEFSKLLDSGVTGLVLDLSGLASLSSAGLGAMVNMSRTLGERGGRLAVAAVQAGVAGTLELLNLGEALVIVETADQAKKIVAAK